MDVWTDLVVDDFDRGLRTADFAGSTEDTLAFIHGTGFFVSIDVNHFVDTYGTGVHAGGASGTFVQIDFDGNHFLHLDLHLRKMFFGSSLNFSIMKNSKIKTLCYFVVLRWTSRPPWEPVGDRRI
jgi:hypothetical protein